MVEQIPGTYPEKLTKAGTYLAELLETSNKPVLNQFDFFRVIWQLYTQPSHEKLYLRHSTPTYEDFIRLKLSLKKIGVIRSDRDYGSRGIRILNVSDQSAENIICLIDPTCYVSHISAMQRWGLTNRNPKALSMTRPDRETRVAQLNNYIKETLGTDEGNPRPLNISRHPMRVRRRPLNMFESKTAGAHLKVRGEHINLSTIGQTFLDMLQKPDLCGGMSHIIDIWEEHAPTYVEEIIEAVDTSSSNLVKSRAGYILEERLSINHQSIEAWKKFGQRGSSRKLDPTKEFVSEFSEAWMISLNV